MITESNRHFTFNGVSLALPTYGGPVDGSGSAAPTRGFGRQDGTAVQGNTTANNPTYNDLLAIWDSYNGTFTGNDNNLVGGAPPNWPQAYYWSATPSSNGHAEVTFGNAMVSNTYDPTESRVAFQVAPVVIDINRDGVLSYSQAVIDVNRDGQLDHSAWAAPQDGLLVWDKFHDGQVRDANQYVFSQGQGQTDLQGLAAQFDTNHDGVLDVQDALFSEFAVWQDSNQNGVSDAGEVRSLADVGLTAINLQSDGVTRQSAPGVHEAGRSSATASDGSSVLVGDVSFAFTSLTSVAATSASRGQIDLASDTSANLLQLSLQDLLALPTETLFDATNTTWLSGTPLQPAQHQLMVTGDSNDVVKIDPTLLTDTHTVVSSNDHTYHVYTVDSAHTQLLIDHNIVNAGRVL